MAAAMAEMDSRVWWVGGWREAWCLRAKRARKRLGRGVVWERSRWARWGMLSWSSGAMSKSLESLDVAGGVAVVVKVVSEVDGIAVPFAAEGELDESTAG